MSAESGLVPPGLSASLADRYAIVRELGRGGMATVYLAHDLKHARDVAIKVLDPELGIAIGADRFQREIEIAARLAHPHILPLHDSGVAGSTVYYVMPYVEGETLRQRMARERQLSLDDALQLVREVADALRYAHAHGVIHRDIKPENILLQGGHALVADFGIARVLTAPEAERLTSTGLSLGTPAYMSPEQAAGSAQVDGRSDLYSLGCVLYEMLAGEPPFLGSSALAVVAKRMSTPAPRISILRKTVPAHIEQALATVLALAPADRYATAEQFIAALDGTTAAPVIVGATTFIGRHRTMVRTVAVVGAALVVAAATWFAIARSGMRAQEAPEPLRAIAVLPFTFLGDSARGALADGFTIAVNDGLGRVEGLSVPLASRPFDIRGRDVREAGRTSNAGLVVTGSVEVAGSRLRVRARLVNVADEAVVWTLTPFDGEVANVFAMQDSITAGIVAALVPRLAASTIASLRQRPRTRDMQAYELWVQARQATYGLKSGGIERAVTLLEQSLARDSTYADAWIALADAYGFFPDFSDLSAADVAARMRRAVEKGIELDNSSGWAFSVRGWLRMTYDWDWEGARSDLRRAVRLSPNSADNAVNYAVFLELVGESDSAVAQTRRAVALDPTNPFMSLNLGTRLLWAGHLDSARAALERTLAMDSSYHFARLQLAYVFAASGRRDDAERETALAVRGFGDTPKALATAAVVYRMIGRPDSVREMEHRFNAVTRRRRVSWADLATMRHAAGDRTGALDALEMAVREHDLSLVFLVGKSLPELKGEPRYEAVHRRVFGNLGARR